MRQGNRPRRRTIEDQVGRLDQLLGHLGSANRDLQRKEPGRHLELVERSEREQVPGIVAEECSPLQPAAQLGHDRSLVDPERQCQLHHGLAWPRHEAVLGRDSSHDLCHLCRNRLELGVRGDDRTPVGRDPVGLVLDLDPTRQGGAELIRDGLDHRAPSRDPRAQPDSPVREALLEPVKADGPKRGPIALELEAIGEERRGSPRDGGDDSQLASNIV